jgi:hypothetical protein
MKEQQPKDQEVFLHITSVMHDGDLVSRGSMATVHCGLDVMVYRTRETAEKAREISGGIVLKTMASELRPFSKIGNTQIANDISLCYSGGENDELDPKDPNEHIFLGLSLRDLPHEMEYGEEGYAERVKFPPAIDAWVDGFVEASGLMATL